MATDVIRVIQYPVNVVRVITAGPQGVAGTGLDTLTTKGDTLGHNGTSAVRLPVGTNGQVLTADSTATPGLRWTTPSATPTAHASSHATGGSDPITPSAIGALSSISNRLVIEATSDTLITIRLTGLDSVVRSVAIPLS